MNTCTPSISVYVQQSQECAFQTVKAMCRRYKVRPVTLLKWVEHGAPCCFFGDGYGRRFPVEHFDQWVIASFCKGGSHDHAP